MVAAATCLLAIATASALASCGSGGGTDTGATAPSGSTGGAGVGGSSSGAAGGSGSGGAVGLGGAAGSAGGGAGGSAGTMGTACVKDADCAAGTRCAFSAALGCGWSQQSCSAGTCVAPAGPQPCGAITIVHACGCDGGDVMWDGGCAAIFAPPLAPVPIAHLGACDAKGTGCSSDGDCGPTQKCRYPAGAGCGAKAECVDTGACNCNNVCCNPHPACSCNGVALEIDCRGFAAEPITPMGSCD